MAYEYDCDAVLALREQIRRQRDRTGLIIGWALVLAIAVTSGVTLGALWRLVQ